MSPLTLSFFCINIVLFASCDPVIQLPNGLISGREDYTFEGKHYYVFEGIPYGAPPVGPLRFQAPQPAPSWDGVRDTTSLNSICFQTSFNYDTETEDCLYLNVYTPQLPEDGTDVSLPVMLFIYGGAFLDGNCQQYRPNYIVNNDVILVTINYRLGVFGFLSTGDEVIPGNAGLKDQRLAIRWTHDNIHLFGGDPNRVTIFGQSSGAAAASYQLLDPNNDGLFQGVILESGTFLGPWAYQRNPRRAAFTTASILNSDFQNSDDSEALRNFLQNVDARDLDNAGNQYRNGYSWNENFDLFQGYAYAPVIEAKNPDAILTRKQYGLLEAGNFLPVQIMVGVTSEEALAFYQDPNSFRNMVQTFDENLPWMVPNDMQLGDQSQRSDMGRRIEELYGGYPLVDHLGDAIRFMSDNSLTRPNIRFAELASRYTNTYFYQFSYDGQLGHLNTRYDGADAVGHSADIYYVLCFGYDCNPDHLNDQDKLTQNRIIKLWTDFAKYQNPTPEASDVLQNVIWPPVQTDGGDYNYLDIGENLEVRNHPKERSYGGWVDLYSGLGTDDFDTY